MQQNGPMMLESKKREDNCLWHAEKLRIRGDQNARTAMHYVTGLNSSTRVVKEAKEQKQRKVMCPSKKCPSRLDVLVIAAHREQGLAARKALLHCMCRERRCFEREKGFK